MTYRTNIVATGGSTIKNVRVGSGDIVTVDPDKDLIPFGGACPWCGSVHRATWAPWWAVNARERWLVPARTWSFLLWRSHPAYFRVRCGHCLAALRELTK